jgi:hypothetical protein
MEMAIFWLPILGGILLGSIAVSAWYASDKIIALWCAFAGLVCFLLVGTIQVHQALAEKVPTLPVETARPWVGIDVELAGPLNLENGIGIPLKITMTNTANTPAVSALPHPMIFTRENQPFQAEEIIKRRASTFQTGGGLGYTIVQNKPVSEISIPSNTASEIGNQKMLSPFVLVAVKYRSPSSQKTYLSANLYSLARKNPGGGARVIEAAKAEVPANDLVLIHLGSFAD